MATGVSVIIPVFNQADMLLRAVNSALAADEVIIVDDGSTDGSVYVASALAAWYDNVCLIRHLCNMGVVQARNTAVQAASYDLVIPLDADDYFLPGGISALVKAWQPKTFVYSNYCVLTPDGDLVQRAAPPDGMLNRKNISQATICFSVADSKRVGGYDPAFEIGAEDWALSCAFAEAGIRPIKIEDFVYCWGRQETDNGRAADCRDHAERIRLLLRTKYPGVFNNARS